MALFLECVESHCESLREAEQAVIAAMDRGRPQPRLAEIIRAHERLVRFLGRVRWEIMRRTTPHSAFNDSWSYKRFEDYWRRVFRHTSVQVGWRQRQRLRRP